MLFSARSAWRSQQQAEWTDPKIRAVHCAVTASLFTNIVVFWLVYGDLRYIPQLLMHAAILSAIADSGTSSKGGTESPSAEKPLPTGPSITRCPATGPACL